MVQNLKRATESIMQSIVLTKWICHWTMRIYAVQCKIELWQIITGEGDWAVRYLTIVSDDKMPDEKIVAGSCRTCRRPILGRSSHGPGWWSTAVREGKWSGARGLARGALDATRTTHSGAEGTTTPKVDLWCRRQEELPPSARPTTSLWPGGRTLCKLIR